MYNTFLGQSKPHICDNELADQNIFQMLTCVPTSNSDRAIEDPALISAVLSSSPSTNTTTACQ